MPRSMDGRIIRKIFPTPTLYDHSYGQFDEIENDIQLLLDWLDPCFPIAGGSTFTEPLPRIKAAIRSCLKDNGSQLDFIQLYQNSVSMNFSKYATSKLDADFHSVVNNLHTIKSYYDQYLRYLNLGLVPLKSFQRHLNSLFRSRLDEQFFGNLNAYFVKSLFSNEQKVELANCILILNSVGFVDEVNSTIVLVSIKKIKEYVLNTCSRVWDKPNLSRINQWVRDDLYQYFSNSSSRSDSLPDLTKIAHDELVLLRINEMYDMIMGFPQSEISLRELHQCILFAEENAGAATVTTTNSDLSSRAYQREKLVTSFIELCRKNLLHSGADTIEIVTYYASTIKAFLIIDPRGVLLDKVVRPIRQYVKTRNDIIPKLVHGLLDNSESNKLIELAHELRKKPKRMAVVAAAAIHDDLDLNWTPDPIDALPDFKKGKVSDIIESIISIFDLKSIFIEEFTTLFGNQLLNLKDYDITGIEENLRLLKLRFGENEFTALEIMIRDIINSRAVNEAIYLENSSCFDTTIPLVFHPKILSHLYWPMLEKSTAGGPVIEEFRLPPIIEEQFSRYNKIYNNINSGRGRTLKSLSSLGLVNLDLELQGQIFQFEVSPGEASIISLFDGEGVSVNVDTIVDQLQISTYLANQYLQLWVKRGVLVEVDVGTFIESPSIDGIESCSRNQLISADLNNLKFSKLDNLWPLIIGMLTNLGPLPLEKIDSFLNITVPKKELEKYSLTTEILKSYLEWCEKGGKLIFNQGLYHLNKQETK